MTEAPDAEQYPEDPPAEQEAGPARALTLHLLRMLETRMDAAGIAISSEVQSFSTRLQMKLLAGAALFFAIWGGIVLLAIALPENYRVPVLSGVVVLFVVAAVWAHLAGQRKLATNELGSMRWFLDGLRLDLEILSRTLAHRQDQEPNKQPPNQNRSPPSDLAA